MNKNLQKEMDNNLKLREKVANIQKKIDIFVTMKKKLSSD